MRTPLIIPACNEAAFIGRTLECIDATVVEPIVVSNGSEDATFEIARSYDGVTALEIQKKGKMPAIQEALRYLGGHALGPVLYTDADSYPRDTRLWANIMTSGMADASQPLSFAGPLRYLDSSVVSDGIRSRRRYKEMIEAAEQNKTRFWGANMATVFSHSKVLSEILAMPNIWPGEDRAIEKVVLKHGGQSTQVLDKRATVHTSSRNLPPLWFRLAIGAKAARVAVENMYSEHAPPGSRPFREKSHLGY